MIGDPEPTRDDSDFTSEREPAGVATVLVAGRRETELERSDRNLNELLAELRVALPGVQVLFAFLLVVPFNQRFGTVSDFERWLYLATLLGTVLASILLIAPTLMHRLEFRHGEKAYVVQMANRLTILGLSVLAVTMTCAVLLVTHYLFSATTAIVATAIVAALFGAIWFALPLRRWYRRG